MPPSLPSMTMKSGSDAGFDHGLDDGHEFPVVADAKLEAHGLAAGKFTQFCDEGHEFKRRCEGGVDGGEMQSLPISTPRMVAISWVTFTPGNTPP